MYNIHNPSVEIGKYTVINPSAGMVDSANLSFVG